MTTTVGLSVTEAADVLVGVIYWLILLGHCQVGD